MDTQRRISFSPPDITQAEIDEVVSALESGWITTGPKTKQLESDLAEYIGANKVACLNSATAALECGLRLLGIGPGDEVITSAYTYTASASAICHVGATPVLCDVAPESFEMNYTQLASLVSPKTRAVIPVDIAGRMVDYDALYDALDTASVSWKPANEAQEQIGHMPVLAGGQVVIVELCMADADIVELQHPVAGRGVLVGGAVVRCEMLYQRTEVETVAVLLDVGMQACKGYVAEMQRMERYLEQSHIDIQCVEPCENRCGIVFIYVEVSYVYMTGEKVDTHMVNMHLASGEVFTMSVHIAFGNRSCQQRYNKDKGQKDAHNPQQYFKKLLHISVFLLITFQPFVTYS